MFPKRPKPDDSEEDLLAEQEHWQAQNKPTVRIQKMKKRAEEMEEKTPAATAVSRSFAAGGRFQLNFDEDSPSQVFFPIQEKNVDWLSEARPTQLQSEGFEKMEYSKESGFPEPLNLSAYFKPNSNGQTLEVTAGRSFFAMEFDRLLGKIDEATCSYKDVSEEPVYVADFTQENDRMLAGMDAGKIEEMQKELQQRLDPKTLEFLATRPKKKAEDAAPTKISKFKRAKMEAAAGETKKVEKNPVPSVPTAPENPLTFDLVKQLEVLDEFYDRDDVEKYTRLAADAVQLDFATKCLKGMVPRQQQNAVRLFDNLKHVPTAGTTDELRKLARSRLDDIKQLYLEEVESEGRRHMQFSAATNPLMNGCWMLRPIRTVLDAMNRRRDDNLTPDDLEIVRLCLLWTWLLYEERRSTFYAFSELGDFYVRLGEVYLLGSDVMADDVSIQCVSSLTDSYLLPAAMEGRLTIRLQNKIADLDAFGPFYEDLLRHYESYSLGNVPFARIILIGSYLNSGVGDSLDCRFAIWSPKQNTARQITARISDAGEILTEIRRRSDEEAKVLEEQHYTQYVQLLGAYAAAIRDEKVTRDRNQLMFTIAAEELGRFVGRHRGGTEENAEQARQFDMLSEIVRSTVRGRLDL